MALHFANQFGNARAVPNLLLPLNQGGITPAGTFWSFAAVTIIGGLWVWFFIPETGGRTLESMERLFQLPWYKIGRYGNRDADEHDTMDAIAHEEEKVKTDVAHVEVPHLEKDRNTRDIV